MRKIVGKIIIMPGVGNQSKNIVIDSCRIKNLRDETIKHYLIGRMRRKRGIRRIIFVNRAGIAVDINSLIWYD